MKKILLFSASLLLCSLAFAQVKTTSDWAFFTRYEAANKEVKTTPKVVFMGDSITENWYRFDKDFFTSHNFLARGISGQTSSHMLVRFQRDVVDFHPKYVVILCGINDIALNNGKISVENVMANIKSMCEIAKVNKIKVLLCSTTPSDHMGWRPEVKDAVAQVNALNALIRDYATSHKLKYIDFYTPFVDEKGGFASQYCKDGVHPLPETYAIMDEMVLKYVK